MAKTGKWILGTLAVLIGLLLVTALCLPLFIDPNDYKETISRQIEAQTGRQVSIPGDIELKVSPVGLKTVFRLGEVQLASSPGFTDTKLVTSRLAEIQLALWPLIRSKELHVSNIRLEGVHLNLIRNEDGSGNWGGTTTATGQKAPSPDQPSAAPVQPLAAFDIGGVEVKDLNVDYLDRKAGTTTRLADFNLSVGRVRPANPIPVQAAFSLTQENADQKPLTARVTAQSSITYQPDQQLLQIQGFSSSARIGGGRLPLPELSLTLASDLDLDLRQNKADIKSFTLAKDGIRLEGKLSAGGGRAAGTLRLPSFSPRAQAAAWGITLPLANPESLNRLAAEMDFSVEPSILNLGRLQLTLDETTVTGTATVRNLNSRPAFDLDLGVDRLDLNRYQGSGASAPAKESAAAPLPPAPGTAGADGNEPLLPVALLRNLDFNANLAIDSLRAGKLSLSTVQAKAAGKDGRITLAPLAVSLYGGSATIQGEIDARSDQPALHLTENVKGLDLGPLLLDLTGKEEVKGRADISGEVRSRGLNKNELTRNSNGTLRLAVADCEIAKLQILDTINAARGLLNVADGQGVPATTAQGASGGRPTAFSRLTASGVLSNGVFSNDDLLGESEVMRVTGKGSVDLVNEQLDYLLTVTLAQAVGSSGQSGLADLAGTPIPYHIRGSFDRLDQSAALAEIVKSQAEKALVKELGKRLGTDKQTGSQQGTGGAEDLINKGLKSLFGK